MPTNEQIDKVMALFQAAGHHPVSPPILQPADIFLDLTGEDIRRRLYLTTGANGVDLCLRPDFTIPVCRAHLEDADMSVPTAYSYHGPVFRQRSDGLGEIPQIGAESFGRDDRNAADADMLALSVKALDEFGAPASDIRIGDEGLFVAVLSGLDLPTVWQRRLRDLFGEGRKLDDALERLSGTVSSTSALDDKRLGFLAALEGADPEAAQSMVEGLLSIAGISTVAGRSASEIAERFLEQAALTSGTSDTKAAADVLKAYLALNTSADKAVDVLSGFAKTHKLDLTDALVVFKDRLDAIKARGLDLSAITFSAGFGRRLDYYTGFIFEIYGAGGREAGQLVGGGRYDRLLNLLGAEAEIPAIGFSIWLDRISGAREASQ